MAEDILDDFDVAQKHWVDFYANEISKCSKDTCLSEEALSSIKSELAAQITYNDISQATANLIQDSLGKAHTKTLLVEDRAFFAYAHARMLGSIGSHVTHIWNQYDVLSIDFTKYDAIVISESPPAINPMLIIHLTRLIPQDKRPVIFVIVDKANIHKYICILSCGVNYVLRKPIKIFELQKLFKNFDLPTTEIEIK